MPKSIRSNMFCDLDVLNNEATVEQYFINRLLNTLGYKDSQIKPKNSLSELMVNEGRTRRRYRPDYAIQVDGKVRWVVEAKATNERLDPFVGQAASYCLQLNSAHRGSNPVTHFLLSNGLVTEVYEWDSQDPILKLSFDDFDGVSPKWKMLERLLSATQIAAQKTAVQSALFEQNLSIRRASISEVNAAFSWCHKFIYRRENYSYSAAFMEFVKVIFLKLLSDKAIHESIEANFPSDGVVEVPESVVKFSTAWITNLEREDPNPLDTLQFRPLVRQLDEEIREHKKKRIFNTDEGLNLAPETIKGVVGKLESIDLYSMDSDLNGRLFETFLNATLRGKDLGQFFTPRSVVKLATKLANLQVRRDHVDTIIDACCGTGGFLIEALADMWGKVDSNHSLTALERKKLREEIATQHIYGIDVAKEPALARIARINMYLHGDGGSRIYQLDALDKKFSSHGAENLESRHEKREFEKLIRSKLFDVALTNPPFAKEYARKTESEQEILDQYELAYSDSGKSRTPVARLKSSMMFIERYHDMLKPGGRLVTVIDDSLLGGTREKRIRDYIRANFVIRAIVSLPGDAFQRSQARVKTSIMVLEKKEATDQEQTPVFMYYCSRVGVDEVARQRVLPIDEANRRAAELEINHVAHLYQAFLNGDSEAENWIVPASEVQDRIDVKACLPKPGRNVDKWKSEGLTVVTVDSVLTPIFLTEDSAADAGRQNDIIISADTDDEVTSLRVRYDGGAEAGESFIASDSTYDVLYRVRPGDIVISHINAVHGAVTVVPDAFDGLVATKEYTVCRPKGDYHPFLIWQMLRTPEARADLLLTSTGMGRTRVEWESISRLQLPIPPINVSDAVISAIEEAHEKERLARKLYDEASRQLGGSLNLNNEEAQTLLLAFKPPR